MAESFLRLNESTEQFYRRCTNLSYFDCSEEEMLWWMMGPRRLPLQEIIPISVVLLVIFLTGVAGNVAVCVVIVRHPAMHTATNYYLFSLALSDLLLLLFGLPNDLSVYWHQYPYSLGIVFCKLRALISEAPEDFQVRAGSTDKLGGVLYDVEDIVYHPKFSTIDFDHDIAVMKVSGKIKINSDTVNVVKLAETGSKLSTGDLVTVSGWGDTTGHADYSDVLKALTLPVFDKEHCREVWQKAFNVIVTDHMVCAGFKEPGQSACHGDSGGPLVDKNLVQYGVVSFGEPSCHGIDLPNVYASVASFRDWIRENTGV